MKYALTFFLFFFINPWDFHALAQSSPLDKRISINANSEKLGKVLKQIEKNITLNIWMIYMLILKCPQLEFIS